MNKRKPKTKARKRSSKTPSSYRTLLVLIIIALSLTGFAKLNTFVRSQIKPVNESSRSLIKKVPEPIRKEQIKQIPFSQTVKVPILLYHYVEYVKDTKDITRESLNISPATLDLQIKTLRDAGFTFMTAGELGQVIDEKRQLPKKPIILTFDDGHWDLYTDILPILKKYHAKATAYIITDFIGGSDYMTSKQLKDVISSGLVEIGAHTAHHASLTYKLLPFVQFEVSQSKSTLERDYHVEVVSFAYPNGSFDEQAIQVVKDAGFTNAVSTVPGIQQNNANRFFLYRLRPGYRVGDDLLNYFKQTSFKPY